MNMREVSTIIAAALKNVNNAKGSVFTAQRACVQFFKEHKDLNPMSRLIVGLHNGKAFNGRALLVFVTETCGAVNGKGGALGWNEKKKALFVRQDKEVTPAMLARLETLPFWEYKKPQALAFTEVKVIAQAIAKVEKAHEAGELKTALTPPQVQAMLDDLSAVMGKYMPTQEGAQAIAQ